MMETLAILGPILSRVSSIAGGLGGGSKPDTSASDAAAARAKEAEAKLAEQQKVTDKAAKLREQKLSAEQDAQQRAVRGKSYSRGRLLTGNELGVPDTSTKSGTLGG